MTKEDLLKGLTPEQQEKAIKCQTTDELLSFAAEEGLELTEEQLEAVSGGGCIGNKSVWCSLCSSADIVKLGDGSWKCQNCVFKPKEEQ